MPLQMPRQVATGPPSFDPLSCDYVAVNLHAAHLGHSIRHVGRYVNHFFADLCEILTQESAQLVQWSADHTERWSERCLERDPWPVCEKNQRGKGTGLDVAQGGASDRALRRKALLCFALLPIADRKGRGAALPR